MTSERTEATPGRGYAGRVAIVTAAGSGIGQAIVRGLVDEGAVVVANDIDASTLEGREHVVPVPGDITDAATVDRVVATATKARGGRIDALFNNAGMGSYRSILDFDATAWQRVIALNLEASVQVAAQVARIMRATGGGAILNTASSAGVAALSDNAAYVVSKHALVGLTRSMAVDLGPYGIRTNALCPGLTATAMNQTVREQRPGYWEAREGAIPLRRAATPEEQAAVALFLNSSKASYVNGLVAVVDGGAHALYAGSGIPRPTPSAGGPVSEPDSP